MDQGPQIDLERVERVATAVRAFLEPRWAQIRADNGHALPRGRAASLDMCRLSSAFLLGVLEDEMPGQEWCAAGGVPTDGDDVDPDMGAPGGFLDARGRWKAHYWVCEEEWGLIVDVTSDQFHGGQAVLVSSDETRHRPNYLEGALEEHFRQVRWRVAAWRQEWAAAHAPGWSGPDAPTRPGP